MKPTAFLLNMAVVSALIWPLAGFESVVIGWGIVTVGAIMLSIEPFSGAALVIAALIGTVFVVSPITGAGATIIYISASIHGIIVLINKSRRYKKMTRDHPGDEIL